MFLGLKIAIILYIKAAKCRKKPESGFYEPYRATLQYSNQRAVNYIRSYVSQSVDDTSNLNIFFCVARLGCQ